MDYTRFERTGIFVQIYRGVLSLFRIGSTIMDHKIQGRPFSDPKILQKPFKAFESSYCSKANRLDLRFLSKAETAKLYNNVLLTLIALNALIQNLLIYKENNSRTIGSFIVRQMRGSKSCCVTSPMTVLCSYVVVGTSPNSFVKFVLVAMSIV